MRLPTPSLTLSVAALVIALGGTGYAVGTINSADVQNNTLTSQDIKNQTLTSKDVKNGSLKAKDLKPGTLAKGGRWVLVNAAGQIEAQSGGFEVKAAYGAGAPGVTVPAGAVRNVYIDANEDLTNNGIVATIALQNALDQGGDPVINNGTQTIPDSNPEFSGEITTTRCAITGVVTCAPTTTNDAKHFVVSPRLSDGQPTDNTNRKRFYIVITGNSSDFVAP